MESLRDRSKNEDIQLSNIQDVFGYIRERRKYWNDQSERMGHKTLAEKNKNTVMKEIPG